MKKLFINRLCYSAILWSTGCNYIDTKMGMKQEGSVEKSTMVTIHPMPYDKGMGHIKEIMECQDIRKYIEKFNSIKESLVQWSACKSKLESVHLTLTAVMQKGAQIMALIEKSSVEPAKIQQWLDLLPREQSIMADQYSDIDITTDLDLHIKKLVSYKATEYQNKDFEGDIRTNIIRGKKFYIGSICENFIRIAEKYPSIKEWGSLQALAASLSLMTTKTSNFTRYKKKDELLLESVSLPREVKVALDEIKEWLSLDNLEKIVLIAEGIVQQMTQVAYGIAFSSSSSIDQTKLDKSYRDDVLQVAGQVFNVVFSTKEITQSMEMIYQELAEIEQKKLALKEIMEIKIKDMDQKLFQLLLMDRQRKLDVLLEGIKARGQWMDKVSTALEANQPKKHLNPLVSFFRKKMSLVKSYV